MPTAALSGLKKFKWLRERMKNVSSATVLMNHIKDFLLREEKIELEKITNAMHSQVMKCLFNLFNFLLLAFCEDVGLYGHRGKMSVHVFISLLLLRII